MAFLKTHTEIYKFFRGKEWFAYIFNMFQESCFSMCLIMTLLWGEITIEWQHKKKTPQNLASTRRIGGPASAVGICRLPESSLKQHTEKKSVLALISVSRAQEFWRMMLNEVNHYYTVGFFNSNPPAIARFFFPPQQLQVKNNDLGNNLSMPLSRIWDVYSHGRQKFIAPALVLILAFTEPGGDHLMASRFESSWDQSLWGYQILYMG